MRERSLVPFCVLTLLSASSLGLVPAPRQAPPVQGSTTGPRTVDLKVESVDVREAIRTVFKAFPGQYYTFVPEVQGKVTADFRGLVLDDALSVLLRQVDGAVKIESGVYQIVPKSQAPRYMIVEGPTQNKAIFYERQAEGTPLPDEPPVVTSDQAFLYVLRQGVVHKIEKASMKEVGKTDLNERRIKIVY